jgi:hypothetical protein
MFGNFDPYTKSALSRVPEGAASDPNFAHKDEIRARPFFVQDATENGVHKYFMLTWAKPAGQPFDCKGCAPLISAAVLVPGEGGWKIESIGRAVLAFGDYGKPPEAQLVQIGPQNYGFLLRVTSSQEKTTTAEALLVPWQQSVEEAMRTVVADTNQGDCGGAYPCFGNWRALKFAPGTNPDYYDISLTLSGTDMSAKPPYRIQKVSGAERLRFENGKYVHVERSGDTITADKE